MKNGIFKIKTVPSTRQPNPVENVQFSNNQPTEKTTKLVTPIQLSTFSPLQTNSFPISAQSNARRYTSVRREMLHAIIFHFWLPVIFFQFELLWVSFNQEANRSERTSRKCSGGFSELNLMVSIFVICFFFCLFSFSSVQRVAVLNKDWLSRLGLTHIYILNYFISSILLNGEQRFCSQSVMSATNLANNSNLYRYYDFCPVKMLFFFQN